jgi:class 3 adenylate cyclase/energy-coupling factor transporter ATP-binding protein EcfA2
VADLADWLAGLGLEKYATAFAEQEIDFNLLPLLTEQDVKELGLPIGPRRKLLEAIATLHDATPSQHDKSERRSEAERRQLTIMFVDLANSTPLALRLDPEAMREVLRDFHGAVTTEIGRLGYVAKLMGDGVLAYFGWPRAHEDDAKRAVAAALAITDAVGRLASPVGEKLACRVGIATGLVVVGELIGEGAAQEHAVVGPTPNLAARLQEVAGPGGVMIAATTRRLLGSSFAVEAIGERRLKGHAKPVALFRVLRSDPRESRFPSLGEEDLGPIVGRSAELATLRLAWEQAKSGSGQMVLVTGEAGIGKSRLLQALANTTAEDKPAQHVFQCSPLHSDNPFWPVEQQLAPPVTIVERGMVDANSLDRQRIRHETVGALAGQLLDSTRPGPALIVFEDAQWADPATVELMRHLAGVVVDMPVLVIVTSRPDNEPRIGTVANLSRLALPKLDGPAAGALVAAIAGRHQLASRLGNEILARSDGIPLFIEEMTKAVIETSPAGEAVSVPATLRDSLIARLDGSPAMKATAQIASCIGRDFDEKLLLRIADVVPMTLEQGLTALLKAGHVVAQGAGRFRFKHALLCDIAYETLLTPRRQKLHQRIAEALEATPNFAEREPETLGRHWFAAGQNGRGEVYWLRARHRVAHWQEQLDALADFLEADTADVIPIHRGRTGRKLH